MIIGKEVRKGVDRYGFAFECPPVYHVFFHCAEIQNPNTKPLASYDALNRAKGYIEGYMAAQDELEELIE